MERFQGEDLPPIQPTTTWKVHSAKFGDAFKHDLLHESLQHVIFLRKMHRLGHSWRRWTSERSSSFNRYAEMWLPLVAKCYKEGRTEQKLIPPPDIAWIWHCHRLAPKAYLKHTREAFGLRNDQYLESNSPFQCQEEEEDDREQDEEKGTRIKESSSLGFATYWNTDQVDPEQMRVRKQTRLLWHSLYPHEPFFKDNNETQGDDYVVSNGVLSGYHVLASCERQSTFLYQVSGPRFAYPSFLQEFA